MTPPDSTPCAVIPPQPAAAPWYGMRILLHTLAANASVWKETPATLRPLLPGLFQKWCDYQAGQYSLNIIADTIAGLTMETGLTIVIPRIGAIDVETIRLLEPLLARMGSRLRLVLGCDLAGHNGAGEDVTRRILASVKNLPGSAVTFTAEPGVGRRLWFNSQPEELMHLTDVCEFEAAA